MLKICIEVRKKVGFARCSLTGPVEKECCRDWRSADAWKIGNVGEEGTEFQFLEHVWVIRASQPPPETAFCHPLE